MFLEELKSSLDRVGWGEHVEAELSERIPDSTGNLKLTTELRALAARVDEDLLSELEQEDGYLIWTLRLAPLVDAHFAARLAQKYISHDDWSIRYWATVATTETGSG